MTTSETSTTVATVHVNGCSVPVQPGETLLDALRRHGIWVPFECGWGTCGTCKATLVSGAIRYRHHPASLRPHDQRLKRIVLCQALPDSPDIDIRPLRVSREPAPHLATVDLNATIIDRQWLADDLFLLTLRAEQLVRYFPGQYAILEVDEQRRCYSMIDPSSPLGTRVLTFLIRVYPTGIVSPRLAELPVGSSLSLQIPYGGAYLRLAPVLWFIAGGTGIAPIRAMLRALLDIPDRPAVRVVYGAATPQHLAFAAELVKLVERLGGEITFTVDRPMDGWDGLTGPVTTHLGLDGLSESDRESLRCFVAGPPGMVTAVEQLLVAAGIPRNRIHADPFA